MKGRGAGDVPLCVDLDGTLVKTDTLVECLLALVRARPLMLLVLPIWLLRGRAEFKRRVAAAALLDPAALPYDALVLGYLAKQQEAGRVLALATAAPEPIARAVAAHLRIFSAVFATTEVNLKGRAKSQRLCEVYGHRGFAYAGDSKADLAVWERSSAAVLVRVSDGIRRQLPSDLPIEADFPRQESRARALRRAIRPHQWIKNILVLVPLLTAHRYLDPGSILAAGAAFVAMCLLASATYIVNDLFDLQADRAHNEKRNRPFAAGAIPLAWGLAAVPILAAGAASVSLAVPSGFGAGLAAYALASLSYTLWLKRLKWIDTVWLAGLYTLRISMGALAIQVPESPWLLAFAMFAFLSLALLKRYTELDSVDRDNVAPRSRGYSSAHTIVVADIGMAAAAFALVVLAMYLRSDSVHLLYTRPNVLWMIVPVFGYLFGRAWYEALGGRMHHDPIVYALTRIDTYVAGSGLVAILVAAR